MRSRRPILGAAALLALAGCGASPVRDARSPSPSTTASPTPVVTSPAPSPTRAGTATASWRRIAAAGPGARRDATFTGDGQGGAWLFGGRNDSGALGDLWSYRDGAWKKAGATGPKPRFGHNAAFIKGRLFVFGGQGGPTSFFNDVWAYDPASEGWQQVSTPGAKPTARYGAGGTAVGDALVVTHGFANSGRFDDTWQLPQPGGWSNVSPSSGRPVKRCLHRSVYVPGTQRILLFGGQTNDDPFLGDTWLYSLRDRTWTQVRGATPGERNLYAAVATGSEVFVYGGEGPDGPLDDVWRFGGAGWSRVTTGAVTPVARSGMEGALVGDAMLVFGGKRNGKLLADLWELTLPA